MPLFSEPFAFDTESDRFEGEQRTRMVQMCPMSATSLNDVVVIEGWDALDRFMDRFEETKSKSWIRCHDFNLGGYEFSHLLPVLRRRYVYVDKKTPGRGEWTAIADDKTVYKVLVMNANGTVMEITCDMRRVGGNVSMESVAKAVRSARPEWFEGLDVVKEETDYHDGWLDPSDKDYEVSVRYAKVDAYSQAMILRWLTVEGYCSKLTAPSTGLQMALAIHYRGKLLKDCDSKDLQWAMEALQKDYPPLDREMQDIAENSLIGGFVYGRTGTHYGTFCHADYSSSYPYEYAFGKMFKGKVQRVRPDSPRWEQYRRADMMRWYLVSFDFELMEGMMPCISGVECGFSDGNRNKKMEFGHVESRLYTESYLEELGHHYKLTNMVHHEMWIAKPCVGEFRDFIEKCYTEKNNLKNAGKSDTADYLMWKLFMNGGLHGKSITRTRRVKRTWFNGIKATVVEVNEPKMNFMIGFTAMQNARERLLRHCRMVIEAGHLVMMCDTDSMVVDCDEQTLRGIIGDWFVREPAYKGEHVPLEECLGRFEIETDKKVAKRMGIEPSAIFDEFRCLGLKRYCEVRTVNGRRLCRKTAFAGMHDGMQEMIMDWETDGREYEWEQTGKKTLTYGANIVKVTKHAKAEDIYYRGPVIAPRPVKKDISRSKRIYEQIKDSRSGC